MLILMAELTRRLQVLVEEDIFAHLETVAREQGTSVAALVRDALRRTYPKDDLPAAVAAERFLARPPVDLGSWEEAKPEIETSLGRGLDG